MDKKSQLEELEIDFARARRKCPGLRETFVGYVGNPDAKIIFLGEAPGYDEELQGQPFIGPSGDLLRSALAACGLKKSRCYVTNAVKFRPSPSDVMGRETRTPTKEELLAFRPLLLREIAIVEPQLVVCIGGTAAKALTKDFDFKISQARGDYFTSAGVACEIMATYHPSYLLRTGGERSAHYADFLADIRDASRIYD